MIVNAVLLATVAGIAVFIVLMARAMAAASRRSGTSGYRPPAGPAARPTARPMAGAARPASSTIPRQGPGSDGGRAPRGPAGR